MVSAYWHRRPAILGQCRVFGMLHLTCTETQQIFLWHAMQYDHKGIGTHPDIPTSSFKCLKTRNSKAEVQPGIKTDVWLLWTFPRVRYLLTLQRFKKFHHANSYAPKALSLSSVCLYTDMYCVLTKQSTISQCVVWKEAGEAATVSDLETPAATSVVCFPLL